MNELHVEMSHCYGISKLKHDFEFDNSKNIHLIYAPNGSMKSSFAKTLMYVSKQSKDKPCDYLHAQETNYAGSYAITLNGKNLSPDKIFVADGDNEFDASKAFPNFLASRELKEKYDAIYNSLFEKKKALIDRLGVVSMSSNCEEELVETFQITSKDTIFTILDNLSKEVTDGIQSYDFKYNDIFDKAGKVKAFVDSNRDKLQTYFEQYEKLLDNSSLFRSRNGYKFGTYQAGQVANSVKDGAFFGVEHKIVLYGKENEPIDSHEKLSNIMISEKNRILNDEGLRNTFNQITAIIDKNSDLRLLKSIIDEHPDWIPELIDFEAFKKKVWKGHLAKPELKTLLNDYSLVYKEKKQNWIQFSKWLKKRMSHGAE